MPEADVFDEVAADDSPEGLESGEEDTGGVAVVGAAKGPKGRLLDIRSEEIKSSTAAKIAMALMSSDDIDTMVAERSAALVDKTNNDPDFYKKEEMEILGKDVP